MRDYSRSEELLSRALERIPLGTQTFSKSHLQFPLGAAPLFIARGNGCRVWDVDGNEYIDLVLALLPVVLGYRDPDVDQAIERQLKEGILFSLATELEVRVAEELARHIPCAEMTKFGKNGSDATTAAIRLARAYTGRERVAVCGYHGWHDWYIGSTTRHLGVPEAVRTLTDTFPFNDLAGLRAVLESRPREFAAVILEPAGVQEPHEGFLEGVQSLVREHGAVLVFDEIITGFRMSMGGAQAHYGVVPDLATFGKSMANGMPLSAITGRAEIMTRMDDIFFSGTFGGECLSLAAALATLGKLEEEGACETCWRRGRFLRDQTEASIDKHSLGDLLRVEGMDWWPRLSPIGSESISKNLLMTLIRQELAERGVLMLSSFNLCLAHRDGDIERIVAALDDGLASLAEGVRSGDLDRRVRGREIQPVFSVR